MKIAILGIKTLPAIAGADRVVEQLLQHYPRENEYFVYLLKSRQPPLRCTDNIHYIYIPAFGGKHLKAFSYFFLCSVHFLFKGKYDAAHVHNSDFGLFCLALRMRTRVRIVGTFHGKPYERSKWGLLARTFLRMSERLFVMSCHALTSVSSSHAMDLQAMTSKHIYYIPNGVDLTQSGADMSQNELRQFGLEKEMYIMFACGRLDATKGLHHLLAAHKNGNWDKKLFVVGDFSHQPGYSRRIEQECEGNKKIILWKNLVSKDVLLALVRNCALFVFPSEVEAMSMVLLEAISCRRLVICSDIQENKEIVGQDYKYLFSLSSPTDLQHKIEQALSDSNQEVIERELYERCASWFDWRYIAVQYIEIYNKSPALSGC